MCIITFVVALVLRKQSFPDCKQCAVVSYNNVNSSVSVKRNVEPSLEVLHV